MTWAISPFLKINSVQNKSITELLPIENKNIAEHLPLYYINKRYTVS